VSTRTAGRLPLWTLPIRGLVALVVYAAVPVFALPTLLSAVSDRTRSGVHRLLDASRWAGQKAAVVGPRWLRRRRDAVKRSAALLDKRWRRATHRLRSMARRR
jgi:hypothetical protein